MLTDVIPFIGDLLVDLFQVDFFGIRWGTIIVGYATGVILFFAIKKLL